MFIIMFIPTNGGIGTENPGLKVVRSLYTGWKLSEVRRKIQHCTYKLQEF